MKIAVNTRLLLKDQLEGIGWYTHELMKRIVRNHPEHDFYFIFDRPYDKDFIYAKNVHPVVIGPPTRHVFIISFWFDVLVRRYLKKLKPDLFFSPDSINSLNPVCKTITTIHDVNFVTNPENFNFLLKRFYTIRTPIIAEKSDLIVTVSEYSKKDIARFLQVSKDKIEVIYNACRPGFEPIPVAESDAIKLKYTDGKSFFLFVGGLYRRKNLKNLVKAFELYKRETESDKKLVVVGKKLKEGKAVLEMIEQSDYRKDIILTGRIDDDGEVKKIMASAYALTYVSILEGFGLPMVEAMKSGVPVIASNVTSMPEIGGDAALYVDPQNPADIAKKMKILSEDAEFRKELIHQALIQSQQFDWDISAEMLWDTMERVVAFKSS